MPSILSLYWSCAGGFVWLELEMSGFYTETDEVFVVELDVIVTFADWVWLRSVRLVGRPIS